jgi:hypothetical protein
MLYTMRFHVCVLEATGNTSTPYRSQATMYLRSASRPSRSIPKYPHWACTAYQPLTKPFPLGRITRLFGRDASVVSSTNMCAAVRTSSACERKPSAHLEDATKDEESVDTAIRHDISQYVYILVVKRSRKELSRLTDQSSMAHFRKPPA